MYGRRSTTPGPTENRHLTEPANDERIQEMMVLLKETSALREPILRIKSTVEETKHIVENIFKSIKGRSAASRFLQVSYAGLHA